MPGPWLSVGIHLNSPVFGSIVAPVGDRPAHSVIKAVGQVVCRKVVVCRGYRKGQSGQFVNGPGADGIQLRRDIRFVDRDGDCLTVAELWRPVVCHHDIECVRARTLALHGASS